MGGKLFNTQRMTRDQYFDLIEKFTRFFGELGREIRIPESFKDKDTFGDLDVLIKGDEMKKEEISQIFNVPFQKIHKNSNVISIVFQESFQVDLCFFQESEFYSAYEYMRHGDSSMLIGRMFHKLGFKYGHKGLLYPLKLNDCFHLKEIEVSKDVKKILEFIDLDYSKWIEGFQNQEDLFHWISASNYFNENFYKLEDLNSVNRTRNKKRPVYMAFIEWCQNNKKNTSYYPSNNKAEYLWQSVLFFDKIEILDIVKDSLNSFKEVQNSRKIFNGNMVREWTGLSGKELGDVLKKFNSFIQEKEITLKEETSKEIFLQWYR